MHLVVEFLENPKAYSVVPVDNLVDGTVRLNVGLYIGKNVKILWGKKHYDVILRDQGTKNAMNKLCDDLATEAAKDEDNADDNSNHTVLNSSQKVSKKRRERIERSQSISSVLSKRTKTQVSPLNVEVEVPNLTESSPHSQSVTTNAVVLEVSSEVNANSTILQSEELGKKIEELEIKIEKLKKSKEKCRRKLEDKISANMELKQKLKLASSNKKKIELGEGSGVFLRASKVAAAKLSSKTPPILARNLFRYLFASDEMKGRSLMGRKCNANKIVAVLPCVDAAKRDAIISFSLEAFNLKPTAKGKEIDEYQVQKARIISSLTKLLREEDLKEQDG